MKKSLLLFLVCLTIGATWTEAQTFRNFIGRATPVEFGVSIGWRDDSLLWVMANYRSTFSSSTTVPALMKLNKSGSVTLARQFTLPSAGSASSVAGDDIVNADGVSVGSVILINQGSSMYVVRCNNNGVVVWARQLSNAAFASNFGLRIKTVYNNNNSLNGFFILATHFSGQGEMVIKLNANGTTAWQRRITHSISGTRFVFRDLQVTPDRGCIVTGYQESNTSNPVLFKFTAAGAVTFGRSYDFFNSLYSGGFGATVTPTGYVVTGSETGGANLTFSTNTSGTVNWAYKYNSASLAEMQGNGIIDDAAGNLVFMGNNLLSTVPAFLVKLTSLGAVTFGKTYYNHVDMNDIRLSHNGYAAIGTSDPTNVNADIYVLNTDLNGNIATACNPATISVTRTNPEFTSNVTAAFTIVNETLTNAAATVTTQTITTQQDRCASSEIPVVADAVDDNAGKFNASADWAGRLMRFEFKTTMAAGSYDVAVYNMNGLMVGRKSLQANQQATLAVQNLQDGLYTAVLTQNGAVIARKNLLWGRQ